MKKMIKSLKTIALLGLILLLSISCDQDFANVESDIQGVKNFEANSKLFPFVAKTQNFTPFTSNGNADMVGLKTNDLTGNLFGIYNNPTSTFGTTVANVISEVVPESYEPDFGDVDEAREVESVWLYIPYFSTLESTDDDDNNTYVLDSILGDTEQAFKLTVYRSNYLLRDLDPNLDFQTTQCYYSNQGGLFQSASTATDLLYTDETFTISNVEHIVREADEDDEDDETERLAPGIRINLLNSGPDDENGNENFWEELFFANQGSSVLSTQSNFKDFFRGLILKAEEIENTNPEGSLTYLNLDAANILFEYTNQEETDAIAADETVDDETLYTLTFAGNTVNTFDQINAEDHDGKEDNIYLKGTDGSMAVLELFSGEIENDEGELVTAFDYFYDKKDSWLINEANLVFYVNQDLLSEDISESDEPNRVILYDLKNNTPIVDYYLDGTTNTTSPESSKIIHSEILTRDDDEKGVRYKIRLTSHITNLIENDSTNVKLGLFIANNLNITSQSKIEGVNNDDDDSVLDIVPSTSVLNPKATILHGYNESAASGLSAEFEIFYTETEN